MPLRSATLSGDPVLEQCPEGTHRMLAGEDGLPVKRLQQALNDLGTLRWSSRRGWNFRTRYRRCGDRVQS